MGQLVLPNAGHPVNGDDLDADVIRGQIIALLGFLQSFDGSNIQPGTVTSPAFDNNTSPTLWRQDSFPSYVTAGGLPSGFSGLNLSIPAIASAYFASTGARLQSISGGSYTVAINNDTYFSLNPNGAIDTPQGVTNNASMPSLPSGSQWLFYAISNGSAIQSIVDLRTLVPVAPAGAYAALARLYRNANKTIVANTWTPIDYDTTDFNSGNYVRAIGTKLYVRYTGLYTIHVHNAVVSGAGDLLAGLSVNAAGAGPTGPWTRTGSDGTSPSVDMERTLLLNAGDYFEAYVYAPVTTLNGTNGGDSSYIEVQYKGKRQ